MISSNDEINRIETTEWCNKNGNSFEPFPQDTYAQNGYAKRFTRLIMEKARAICLSANLRYKLWKNIVFTAIYLYNRTPLASKGWKSPYKAFHSYVFDKEEVSGPRKPHLHHLRVLGCKAYVLIKLKKDFHYHPKRRKLDAKAHISSLIGSKLTNIYRIWMPNKKRVVSIWDLIFKEDEIWDGMSLERTADKIKESDETF